MKLSTSGSSQLQEVLFVQNLKIIEAMADIKINVATTDNLKTIEVMAENLKTTATMKLLQHD
jgi:hypothetical protein